MEINVDNEDAATETCSMAENAFTTVFSASLPHHRSPELSIVGEGSLPSAFAVTDLAVASIAAAGREVAALIGSDHVAVDRRLASAWFQTSIRPVGWELPPVWDVVAGDYETADGWIRLHTNAPHHRAAAMAVLDCSEDREAVATAVAGWNSEDLEFAVVEAGGCAATMRDIESWRHHPQGGAVAQEDLIATTAAQEIVDSSWRPQPHRPLAGVRVLDLTRVLAGPVGTRFLAGYGANVLRIDPPDWDEPSVAPDVTLGKRCARLNLRSPADRRQFASLVARADVLVHGYRSDALERLGFGTDELRRLSPGLVDVALDAYGWSGRWATRRGFDSLVQMSSGIAAEGMRRSGADRPVPLPVQALDHAAGYLVAAAAVRGLRTRLLHGLGSVARLSLARTAAALIEGPAGSFDDRLEGANHFDSAEREESGFGPLYRLAPPLDIAGVPERWTLAANKLGSSPAHWSER
jgi:CoA-transferase family III